MVLYMAFAHELISLWIPFLSVVTYGTYKSGATSGSIFTKIQLALMIAIYFSFPIYV